MNAIGVFFRCDGASRSMPRIFMAVLGGFLLAVAICATAIWLISADARRQIDRLATANSDNSQWSLAQIEVELLALVAELESTRAAQEGPTEGALAELRRRYDIFYSRVLTMTDGKIFDSLRENAVAADALANARGFLSMATPIIDSSDAALVAALPGLRSAASDLRGEIRALALEGVRVSAQASHDRREKLGQALSDLAVIVVLLFSALIVAVFALGLLFASSRLHARRSMAARNRLQAVISTSFDAILVAGPDGRIRSFNAAASEIYGYTRDEAIGTDIADLMILPEKWAEIPGLPEAMRQGSTEPVRIKPTQSWARRRSGRVFPVELSITSANSHGGRILVAFVRDISQRVAEQAELIEARDRAVAGERSKARMLAVMSHEMRTPLNGVLGTLELLQSTALNVTQRRYAEVMEQSGRMLLSHVNAVLDISQADSGQLVLAAQPFDPGEIAAEVIEGLHAEAERRGNRLVLNHSGPRGGLVTGDPGRIAQILVNLIGNAIKFTENGTITVEVDRSAADADMIRFRVSDTGIGIPPGQQERIFEEFVTLDSSYGRGVEGTGLGLSIVRGLVGLMGGRITLDSTPGQGSSFLVSLRLPEQADPEAGQPAGLPAEPEVAAPPAPAGPVDVLVVEDNAVNRMIAREMLLQRGCRVTEAEDGQQALVLTRQRPFDAIFMDISMPHLDGIAATRQIRRQGGPNAETPVIALTAHALPDDLAYFRAAGMVATLTKPLSLARLDEVLARLRSGDPLSDAARFAATQPAPPPETTTPAPGGGAPMRLADARERLVSSLGSEVGDVLLSEIMTELHDGFHQLLHLAPQPEDHAALARLAHRMAGLAALIGFGPVHTGLWMLETQTRHGPARNIGALRRQISTLQMLMPPQAEDHRVAG